MNDESIGTASGLAVVLSLAAVTLVLLASPASAQQTACTEVLGNQSEENRTQLAPGERLAGVIGSQRERIGSALNDRWFDARLANATTARQRADIVAAEVERIAGNVSTLERCLGVNRSRRTTDVDGRAAGLGGRAVDLDPARREALGNRTRSLHRRLNETQVEAGRLAASLRERHRIDAERLAALERRLVALRNVTERTETGATPTGSTAPRAPPF